MNYDKKILKIPKELKKIIYHEKYKFKKDFKKLNKETYFYQIEMLISSIYRC